MYDIKDGISSPCIRRGNPERSLGREGRNGASIYEHWCNYSSDTHEVAIYSGITDNDERHTWAATIVGAALMLTLQWLRAAAAIW